MPEQISPTAPTVSSVSPQNAAAAAVARERLANSNKAAASWLFVVAVLSVVNSIIVLAGSNWNFIVGLGATQIIDGVVAGATQDISAGAKAVITAIALLVNVLIAGIYFVLGIFARKRHSWAYITAMALYGLDGVIFLFAAAWLNVAFHAFVLFSLFNGLKTCRQLAAMENIQALN